MSNTDIHKMIISMSKKIDRQMQKIVQEKAVGADKINWNDPDPDAVRKLDITIQHTEIFDFKKTIKILQGNNLLGEIKINFQLDIIE